MCFFLIGSQIVRAPVYGLGDPRIIGGQRRPSLLSAGREHKSSTLISWDHEPDKRPPSRPIGSPLSVPPLPSTRYVRSKLQPDPRRIPLPGCRAVLTGLCYLPFCSIRSNGRQNSTSSLCHAIAPWMCSVQSGQ